MKLPPDDIRFPLAVVVQMLSENICRVCGWFSWRHQQSHMRFLHPPSALAMIACGAGGDNICPNVSASHVTGKHVIHGHSALAFAAILAGIIVPSKDLASRQLDVRTRPVDLALEADDRWTRNQFTDGANVPASVHDHAGFAGQ